MKKEAGEALSRAYGGGLKSPLAWFFCMLCPIGFPQGGVGWVPLPGRWCGGSVLGSEHISSCSPLSNYLCYKHGH